MDNNKARLRSKIREMIIENQTYLFEHSVLCYFDPITCETIHITSFDRESAIEKMKVLLQDGVCAWIKQE